MPWNQVPQAAPPARISFEQETIFPGEKFCVTITEPGGKVRHETRTPEKGIGEYAFAFALSDGRTARASGYCSPALDDLVKARVRFIVANQQCLDEKSPLYGAFLPYDNEDGRQCFSAEWRDMNACRERTAMPIMVAKYLQLHGEDAAARRALDLWEQFALREFFDAGTCAVYDGIGKDPRFKRLYNGPQLIGLWKEMYLLKLEAKYLDWIERSIASFYDAGGTNFYPNGCSFSEELVLLRCAGRDVSRIERQLREHVANIVRNGVRPPAHEVKYEQTIVAPAVTILASYSALVERDEKAAALLPDLVDMLSRFNGNQPDHSVPYTYYFIGKQEKAQAILDLLMDRYYDMGEDHLAYAGMDDAGEMSAWYVSAALGLYTYSPADPEYIVTVPLFPRVSLNVQGRDITIRRQGEGRRITALQSGGRALKGWFVTHRQLLDGGLTIQTE